MRSPQYARLTCSLAVIVTSANENLRIANLGYAMDLYAALLTMQ